MQVTCNHCENHFEREAGFRFCPYCGHSLDDGKRSGAADDLNVAGMIDFVWGENAKLRRRFEGVIVDCISAINLHGKLGVCRILPEGSITRFEETYEHIKQSSNRRVLIQRVDEFVVSLGDVLENLFDEIPEDQLRALQETIDETVQMCKELYTFLGLDYEVSSEDIFEDFCSSVKLIYSKDQLQVLYELVLEAYEKYKRCVEDNNMFAAFASDSDYGSLHSQSSLRYKWWNDGTNKKKKVEQKKSEEAYQQITEYLVLQNAVKYRGMLDEDFAPHVDAFWHGLEALCTMIDDHLFVPYDILEIRIDREEVERTMRLVSGREFDVNTEKVEQAYVLKKRLEER